MSAKPHPKYKTIIDRRGEPIKIKVSMMDCPHCKHRCAGCHWPFTLSTAIGKLEELMYCSEDCNRVANQPKLALTPTYYKRGRHYD